MIFAVGQSGRTVKRMRLIDADSLISLVMDSTILGDGFKQAFAAIVNGEPSVQPILCGECKHYKQDSQGIPYCYRHRGYGWDWDDFCSYAERRK